MANADTPEDALTARNNGAQGIGLCRTEHMVTFLSSYDVRFVFHYLFDFANHFIIHNINKSYILIDDSLYDTKDSMSSFSVLRTLVIKSFSVLCFRWENKSCQKDDNGSNTWTKESSSWPLTSLSEIRFRGNFPSNGWYFHDLLYMLSSIKVPSVMPTWLEFYWCLLFAWPIVNFI